MSNHKNGRKIVMIGPAIGAQGGMATVVGVLRDSGLFQRCNIVYIPSHAEGGIFAKIVAACAGWLRCMAFLIRKQAACLHVHTASRTSFWRKLLFILPAFACRVPVIVHLHGGEFKQFYGIEGSLLVRVVIRLILKRAKRVIVLSEGWREWVSAIVPDARVVTIYNPVAMPVAGMNVRRDSATLLFLGRISKAKGALDLIEAVARVKCRIPEVKLLFAGDGDLQAAQDHAGAQGVKGNIAFLGWVRGTDKQRLLETASIFVLPSYNEGLPMGMLEAMASGMPVVSTPVGGIPEAIRDGVEGYLVMPGDVSEMADRLALLLGNAELRRRMGEAARKRAKDMFSINQIAPQLEAIYAEVGALSGCAKHQHQRM